MRFFVDIPRFSRFFTKDLSSLITRRSLVQTLPPQPLKKGLTRWVSPFFSHFGKGLRRCYPVMRPASGARWDKASARCLRQMKGRRLIRSGRKLQGSAQARSSFRAPQGGTMLQPVPSHRWRMQRGRRQWTAVEMSSRPPRRRRNCGHRKAARSDNPEVVRQDFPNEY